MRTTLSSSQLSLRSEIHAAHSFASLQLPRNCAHGVLLRWWPHLRELLVSRRTGFAEDLCLGVALRTNAVAIHAAAVEILAVLNAFR